MRQNGTNRVIDHSYVSSLQAATWYVSSVARPNDMCKVGQFILCIYTTAPVFVYQLAAVLAIGMM